MMFELSKAEQSQRKTNKDYSSYAIQSMCVCVSVYIYIYMGMMKIESVINNLGFWKLRLEWKGLCFEEEIITRLVCELCV